MTTSLLLNFDGANASTTITDQSPSPLTWTANGSAQLSTANFKFGGSSGLFNGTNAYCSASSNARLSLVADFTIEGWVRIASTTNQYGTIIGSNKATQGFAVIAFGAAHANAGKIGLINTSGTIVAVSTTSPTIGTFTHFAISRSGTSLKLFLSGVLEATVTNSATIDLSDNGTRVGSNGWDGSSSFFDGNIDNLRVQKGFCAYTATFSVPTGPVTALTRQLLVHANQVSGSTIVDSGDYAVSLTNTGVTFSSDSKFGPSSLNFNGSAKLTTSDWNASNLNPDAFCMEMFFKTSQTGQAYTSLISKKVGAPGTFTSGAWLLSLLNSSGAQFPEFYAGDYSSGGPMLASSIGSVSNNSYHHIVIDYDGTTYRMFIDGALAASRVSAVKIASFDNILCIGDDELFSPRKYNGKIDELRIVGYSVYTSPFTPPTAPFDTNVISAAITDRVDTVVGALSHPAIANEISGAINDAVDTVVGTMERFVDTRDIYGSLTLPMITVSGTVQLLTDGGSLTLPMLTAGGYGGSEIKLTLPMITASGAGLNPYSLSGALTLPMITAEGTGTFDVGAQGVLTLPRMTASGFGGSEIRLTLPMITATGSGLTGVIVNGSVTLPMITVTGVIQGSSGVLINGAITLPMLVFGPQAYGAVTLPMITATGRAHLVQVIEYEGYVVNLKHTNDFNPAAGESATNQVTRYLGIPAQYMMRVGGNQYFVTGSTILRQGGTTDSGDPISWEFKTGLSDNKSRNLKSHRYVYVGGRVTAGFSATILSSEFPDGQFACSQPRSNLPRNTRVTAARGARSRYVGFGLKDVNGNPCMVESIEIEVDVSQRGL